MIKTNQTLRCYSQGCGKIATWKGLTKRHGDFKWMLHAERFYCSFCKKKQQETNAENWLKFTELKEVRNGKD